MLLSDVDLLEQLAVHEARESFWAYRRYLNPKMKLGWFQMDMAVHLQQFSVDLQAGLRPKLVIQAPPQHGKSKSIVEFVTWLAGKNPDLKTIYTSFSERLGVRANLQCQRIYDSDKFRKTFPKTRIAKNGLTAEESGGATRNRDLLEYVGGEGLFRNTTVRGSITGEGLDLGVVDDPIRGRADANSATNRDATWDWFTDDFFTRFSDEAGLLIILTRWHIDDVVGRLRAEFGAEVKVVSYSALAVVDEPHRKKGEPLFPVLKSESFLLERKTAMASSSWESLYQQNPTAIGGEIIKGAHFIRYVQLPRITERNIYGDTAMKAKEHNDYSVLQCWGKGDDTKLYLIDQVRGKWEGPELERRATEFWNKHKALDAFNHGPLRRMRIEDKASGTGLIQKLKAEASMPITGIERSVDKYTRLMDILGYIEAGKVCIPANSPFTSDFVSECEAFTADDSHQYDDQIDPMIDAITEMIDINNTVNLWTKLGKGR